MFRPYHAFANCTRLEALFKRWDRDGALTDDVRAGYNTYHYAIRYKLLAAKHILDSLHTIVNAWDLTEASKGGPDTLFRVNLAIDTFLYTAGGALDILARELLIYFGIPYSGWVYYQTARQQIHAQRRNDPILPRLDDPPWRAEFANYRNTATHERMIASNFHVDASQDGDQMITRVQFPLPDDPRRAPDARTFRRNPDAVKYADDLFRRLLRHINIIYGEIHDRAVQNGGIPI